MRRNYSSMTTRNFVRRSGCPLVSVNSPLHGENQSILAPTDEKIKRNIQCNTMQFLSRPVLGRKLMACLLYNPMQFWGTQHLGTKGSALHSWCFSASVALLRWKLCTTLSPIRAKLGRGKRTIRTLKGTAIACRCLPRDSLGKMSSV